MDKHDAAFIIAEIHAIKRYGQMIQSREKELARIAKELSDIAKPQSPNAGTTIKEMTFNKDGSVKSMGEQYRSQGRGKKKETRILELITEEQEITESRDQIVARLNTARMYKKQIETQTEMDPFVMDFIKGIPYKELTRLHAYENPYKRMINILTKLEIKIK